MKRKVRLAVAVLLVCASFTACNSDDSGKKPPQLPPEPPRGEKVDPIISGGNYDAGENYGEQEDEETVVTPIQPGGNYDGDGYGD